MFLQDDSTSLITEAVQQEALPILQQTISMLATRSGWPYEIIRMLTVIFTPEGAVKVIYPSYLKEEIEDLEYGSEDDPTPTYVIRGLYSRAPGIIEEITTRVGGPNLLDTVVSF